MKYCVETGCVRKEEHHISFHSPGSHYPAGFVMANNTVSDIIFEREALRDFYGRMMLMSRAV